MNHFADDEPLSGVIGGAITGCEVILDPSKDGGFAYNAHWARNLVINNNVSTGARRGFNNDSTPNEGLVIASNKFTFPKNATGLLIMHDTHYSRIYSNWFVFTGPVPGTGDGSGFLISGPQDGDPGAGNLLLENNKVEYEGEWSAHSFGFHLYNHWIPLTGKLHLERNSAVGDFHNEGKVDIVFQNSSDGTLMMWEKMNGLVRDLPEVIITNDSTSLRGIGPR